MKQTPLAFSLMIAMTGFALASSTGLLLAQDQPTPAEEANSPRNKCLDKPGLCRRVPSLRRPDSRELRCCNRWMWPGQLRNRFWNPA